MRIAIKLTILLSCFIFTVGSGCSYLPRISAPKMPKLGIPRLDSFPGVYKIDIQQGNVITQEMVDQLQPGMTKRQVQFVMGTSLVRDTFNQNRWDYIYSFQPGGETREQESLTLFFENELLSRFEGDFMPSEIQAQEDQP